MVTTLRQKAATIMSAASVTPSATGGQCADPPALPAAPSPAVQSLPTTELARLAGEACEKYRNHQAYDSELCFELLRRALVDQSAEALAYVFQHYERQLLNWVYQHHSFAQTGESVEYFANAAFAAFYFALRGPKFNGFSTLPAVLQYLKQCVHTAIMQYLRDQYHSLTFDFDTITEPAQTPDMTATIEVNELKSYISQLLPDKHDQLLVDYVFEQGLKPRHISALFNHRWSSQRDVSVALYRIRRTLRADPELAARAY